MVLLNSKITKTLLVATSFKVGRRLYKNTSVEAGFAKGLPDGTICNGANEFSAHRFPAEGAIAKGLPVVTIDNGALHLVGLGRSLARL